MTRTADRLTDAEATLSALVEAINANADEHARRHAEILERINHLDETAANLAEVIQAVMASRTEHDAEVAAHAKRAAKAAESAFAGVQALATVATAKPGLDELAAAVHASTEAVRQVHQAVTVPQAAPDPWPAGAPRGKT